MITYLALGDSYTIGEGVTLEESFPHQTVALLRQKSIEISDPRIIATTGWTTDELNAAIDAAAITGTYDIVSLLIGVNNQYRGRAVEDYAKEFEGLLRRAIGFADGDHTHVFVLSIPDWGITPFAEGRDREEVAKQIDAYNEAAKAICQQEKYNVTLIDITPSQRADGNRLEFLVEDGLHPSGKEYAKWAERLVPEILKVIS